MDEPQLPQLIESLLFYKAEPMSKRQLAKLLDVVEEDIQGACDELGRSLASRGIRLMQKDDVMALATAPETARRIETLRKEELSRDLGKAALETLSIVLYRGPVSRAEIDYIRGVNSTFILRSLLIRGLIERTQSKDDQRSFLYRPTLELLGHLGITSIEELPEFDTVKHELKELEEALQLEHEEHGEQRSTDTTADA